MKDGIAARGRLSVFPLHQHFPAAAQQGNCAQAELRLRRKPSGRVVIDRVYLRDSDGNNRRPRGVQLKDSAEQAEFDARPGAAIGQCGERVRAGGSEFVQEMASAARLADQTAVE